MRILWHHVTGSSVQGSPLTKLTQHKIANITVQLHKAYTRHDTTYGLQWGRGCTHHKPPVAQVVLSGTAWAHWTQRVCLGTLRGLARFLQESSRTSHHAAHISSIRWDERRGDTTHLTTHLTSHLILPTGGGVWTSHHIPLLHHISPSKRQRWEAQTIGNVPTLTDSERRWYHKG